jgi:hypothetical protein
MGEYRAGLAEPESAALEIAASSRVRLGFPYLMIGILAALVTLPALLADPLTHDSFWIDWVWADQFTEQLRRGVIYPRWLPRSHDGLGSPAFYYYPPLAFYLTGTFGLLGLPTYWSIIAAFGAASACSGVAMFHWLKGWTSQPLAGSLFYVIAPYHVYDFYARGALAESCAIALIPLVALGLRRISDCRGPALAAIAYAALIATHLPLALIASLFLILPYTLVLTWGYFKALPRYVAALGFGIGLSAVYLVPALALGPYRDAAQLWMWPKLQPVNWSIFYIDWRTADFGVSLVFVVTAAIALSAAAVFVATRSRWAVYAGVYSVIAAGFLPMIWDLPLLRNVQFPFRLLPLAGFALATALAVGSKRRALTGAIWGLSILVSAANLKFLSLESPFSISFLAERHPDVPENLPKGARTTSWPSRWALDLASSHRRPAIVEGNVVEPLFYFPAWRVRCQGREVATWPDAETQLLSYRGDRCRLRLAPTWPELAGAALSAFALLALLALGTFSRNSSSRRAPG